MYLKWWKGRTYNQEYSTSKILIQIWWRNQNLPRQVEVKRIQHHQNNFLTNTKGTSLCRKHKKRKRSTQDKPRTIKKMVIGSSISMIILNVNGLNPLPKDIDWLDWWKHVHVCTSTYYITLLNPLKLYIIILLFYNVRLIMFSLWLAIVIIF